MKYLLVIVVVAVVLWLMFGRSRVPAREARPAPRRRLQAPVPMIGCARCGVHLPADDAVTDDAGRPYCCDAHRAAGPR